MALGGGIWAVQNKVLPGTYINFSSVAKASATLSERGYAAMPLVLDWGPDNTVFAVTSGDFQKRTALSCSVTRIPIRLCSPCVSCSSIRRPFTLTA